MTDTPFRLAWFTAYGPRGWDMPEGVLHDWRKPAVYREMSSLLETRGGFDGLIFADTPAIADGADIGTHVEYGLEGISHDPMPMLAAVAGATEHLGLVATLSTQLYPPYILARALATLDTLSNGRAGWNIVTSAGSHTAELYGRDSLPAHDDRYELADEFVDVAERLWEAWDADAVVMDAGTGIFADPAKVRTIDFEGAYYSVRGPLTLPRSPQGVPVLCQAGASDRGRRFAAEHADMIIVHASSVPLMKEIRDDIRARLVEAGRSPDSCKVFFTAHVIVGETGTEAQALRERLEALPTTTIEAGRAALEATKDGFVIQGDPEHVADQMAETMQEIGGDGFAIRDALLPSFVVPLVDRVVPILRRRGLVRQKYHYPTMRENLLDPHFTAAAVKEQEGIGA
jgi:FMN-dependent oxidoreductase (nitrilotriacetate monooxygenase family)